ncbi:MAG TPA: hypothetical protein VFJ29_07860 [Candidatus Kapabacteria bacterium]|nr:hypothetical protein [Candidatus Kapabacteria bacterium]
MLLFAQFFAADLYAQDSSAFTPPVSFGGSLTVTADLYSYSATPDSAQKGRRPPSVYRVLFSPTLSFGKDISFPLNLNFTTPETNTLTPSVRAPTLAQFFENPANAFGFSSFTPRIAWAQFSLGSTIPNYSALSAGNQQIFGGGFDLKPGSFEFAASVGTSQRAIEPDTANHIAGAYRRDMYMTRLAFGKEESGVIGLNLVYAKDALGSVNNTISSITPAHVSPTDSTVIVPADTVRLNAQEGVVASIDAKMHLSDAVSIKAEGAISSFTNDESSPEKQVSGDPFTILQQPRTSTRIDFAGTGEIAYKQKAWGMRFTGLYMGAGFVPVGYIFTQADKLEFTWSPYLRLFDNRYSFDGSIGERINNLSGTVGETTTQLIGSANLNAEITDAFSLSAQYSNFGIRNDQTLDSLKVETVSQSLSITPSLTLQQESMTHTITASFDIDVFKDYNVISGASGSNDTRTLMGSYTVALNSIPLSVGLLGSYMENRLSTGTLIIRSVGATLGYAFFDRKLMPSVSVTGSGSTLGSAPTDDQVFFKFSLRWQAMKKLDLTASVTNNNYTYGDPLPQGSAFRETLFQFAASTRF